MKLDTGATSVGISSDDNYLAVGTRKGTIKLYEVDSLIDDSYLTIFSQEDGHDDIVMDISFSVN